MTPFSLILNSYQTKRASMRLNKLGTNQTEVILSDGYKVLFSYNTPVAAQDPTDMEYYKTATKWSSTTSRHINKWLDGCVANIVPQEFFERLTASADD